MNRHRVKLGDIYRFSSQLFANEKNEEETEDQMQGYILCLSPFLIFFPNLEDIYIDRTIF